MKKKSESGEKKPSQKSKKPGKKNTVILCADEMLLSTQTTIQKIWLPEGEYPQIEVSNNRKNKSLYGFLNLKTGREHAFAAGSQEEAG